MTRSSVGACQKPFDPLRLLKARAVGEVGPDEAVRDLWPLVIVDTKAETLFRAMKEGAVSTNVYLRRIHNFCVDMNLLAWPSIPKTPVACGSLQRETRNNLGRALQDRRAQKERRAQSFLAARLAPGGFAI
jgi:hypothetical protein